MLVCLAGVALGEACSIVLRGATQQILDEAERSLHDALCVMSQTVKETRTVFGGGELPQLSYLLFTCCEVLHWRDGLTNTGIPAIRSPSMDQGRMRVQWVIFSALRSM